MREQRKNEIYLLMRLKWLKNTVDIQLCCLLLFYISNKHV